ncbi:MAG: MarR family transcriptional regulator [Blastocatellales bacterium]
MQLVQPALFDTGAAAVEQRAKPKRQRKAKPDGDITARKHGGHARSVEAYENNKEGLTKQEARVLQFIESRKEQGAIADEVSRELGISGQSSSARMSELKARGLIAETELTRLTQWRNRATVCVAPEYLKAANANAVKEV